MALTHCPECKKEISSNARSCPHCGYQTKNKGCITNFIYFSVAIIALFFILNWLGGHDSSVIEDTRTYEQNWRSPDNQELNAINRLMIKKNVSGCGEYQIKEIEKNEFVIACTPDGKNWTYYVAWPSIDEINLANEKMNQKLKPPY